MDNREVKILSIIPYKVLPAKLGGEKGIALFNEYLSRIVPLTAVSTVNNDPSFAKEYKLLNILSNSRTRYFNVFLFWKLKRIIKKEKATHLLIEHPYFGWLAWMLTTSLGIKWIVHSHNIEYMRSKSIGRWWWKGLKWYEGWVYKCADKVFFISEDDRKQAQSDWNLDPSKTLAVTFGIEESSMPKNKEEHKRSIYAQYGLEENTHLLLFNGALYHSTNYEALQVILDKINPELLKSDWYKYKILICGKGLPDSFNDLKEYKDRNIIYAGFVDDISLYFKAADIFLNPILSGGGVKTKAIEALAMNCSVVSTELGAMGIKKELCGNKLIIIRGNDWHVFSESIISASSKKENIPNSFFDYYYWGNIVKKVSENLPA